MKLLITTRTDDSFNYINDLTHPSIMAYAKKVGADFKRLSDPVIDCTYHEPYHYRVLCNYNELEEYDRILHVDSDVLFTKNAPNIFELVPENKIGVVYEDCGTRTEHRREVIQKIQNLFGHIGWKEGYPNPSFIVVSKQHKDIFKKIDGKYYEDWGCDCAHIGYNIFKCGFEVCSLEYKWNHMVCFAEPWNGNPFRFNSFMVHYAGSGVFDEHLFREGDRISQIKHDVKTYKDLILGY